MRHVVVMAGTGAIGLVAVFAVDLINLFYISRLGEKAIAAAVGFAGVVAFFHTSICIGMMIGITACVARLIGANRMADARRMASHSLLIMLAGIVAEAIRRSVLGTDPKVSDADMLGAQMFLAAVTLVGLHVDWNLNDTLTVYAHADNLIDKRYEEVWSYVSPGRQVMAGVRAHF